MKNSKFFLPIFLIVIAAVFVFVSFFWNESEDIPEVNNVLYFDQKEMDQTFDLILSITPSSSFNIGDRILKVKLPGSSGAWCKEDGAVLGVSSDYVLEGNGVGGEALPGNLEATCFQDADGDYLEVVGVGELLPNVNYGFKIDANSQFKTASIEGENTVSVEIIEGSRIEEVAVVVTSIVVREVIASDPALLEYSITYDANEGDCVPSTLTVREGESSPPPSCTRQGHTLTGFTLIDGSGGGLDVKTGEIGNVTGNQTIRADWSINTYTLTYETNGGFCSFVRSVVNYGEASTPPTCTRQGYTLAGFTRTNGSGGSLDSSTGIVSNVTEDQSIRVDWTINPSLTPSQSQRTQNTTVVKNYTVNYDSNGGSCTPTSRTIKEGGISNAPSCSREGYRIGSFTRALGSGGNLNSATGEVRNVSGDQTIRVDWIINQYTMTYDSNGGSCKSSSALVNYGLSSPVLSCSRQDHILTGFTRTLGSLGKLNSSSGVVDRVLENQTIRADWSSFVINNNDLRTSSLESNTLSLNCPAGYSVQIAYGTTNNPVNWRSCLGAIQNYALEPGDGEKTLYLRFKDSAGNVTSSISDSIILDTSAPVGGSFVINNEALYSTSVSENSLNVTCPTDSWGPVQMAYGNSSEPTNWTTCLSSVNNFNLEVGNGAKTVYMRFRDGGGNTTDEITGSIELDVSSPTISASNASEVWYDSPRTATIIAHDSYSGLSEVRYSWGENEMDVTCTSGGNITEHGEALLAPYGGTTLYLCGRDNAGNVVNWSGKYNWSDEPELWGYAKTDTLGDISFNCLNSDDCLTSDYRVKIINGFLVGNAWSSELGWLRFDPPADFVTGQYPEGLQHSAKVDFDGETCGGIGNVCGWARFCDGTVNGDCNSETDPEFELSGWVNLNPINNDDVTFNNVTGEFLGVAQGPKAISFNCSNNDECEENFYKVRILPYGGSFTPESMSWTSENIEVEFGSIDPNYPIARFRYCVTSGASCQPFFDGDSVILTEDGEHTICMKAQNTIGIWGTTSCSAQGAYKIDTTSPADPTFSLESQDWTVSNISVSFDSNDTESGIQGYRYCSTPESFCPPDTTGAQVTLTESRQHTICAQSQNNAGVWSNIVCTEQGVYKLDNTPPNILASNASEVWYDTRREATVSAIDPDSGVLEVRYNWGSSSEMNETCTEGGTVTTHGAILEPPSGSTRLYLCARDNLGNVSTWNGTYNWGTSPLEGYAWAGDLGWISFNCSNHDGCGASNYRVKIQGTNFVGYAWSEHVGWLRFDPPPDFTTGLYPEGPQHGVKIDLDGSTCGGIGNICGWARFCTATVGGNCTSATETEWDGWVKLGPLGVGEDYVSYNDTTEEFSGDAWVTDERSFSEISFNCEDYGVCGTSFYKVILSEGLL